MLGGRGGGMGCKGGRIGGRESVIYGGRSTEFGIESDTEAATLRSRFAEYRRHRVCLGAEAPGQRLPRTTYRWGTLSNHVFDAKEELLQDKWSSYRTSRRQYSESIQPTRVLACIQ